MASLWVVVEGCTTLVLKLNHGKLSEMRKREVKGLWFRYQMGVSLLKPFKNCSWARK